MIIDTHCHLIDKAFDEDRTATIDRAIEAGVEKMIVACCNEEEATPILELCRAHRGNLYASVGLHPEEMAADIRPQLDALETFLLQHHEEIVAVGEIGLDLYWDQTRLEDQKAALLRQVEWSLRFDLPMLIHIRNAMPEFLDLLRGPMQDLRQQYDSRPLRGVLHCYSGSADEAREALRLGDFYFGIGGTVTYKKSLVPDVVRALGLERIILETDCPYLAPVPRRGRRNEPAYTALTAQWIAEDLGLTGEEVAATTSRNAEALFKKTTLSPLFRAK